MKAVTNRRTFVRNAIIGVPMVAGLASMSHVLDAHAAHDAARLDPGLDSLLRDLARLHNQVRRRPITADDIRAFSAHVRSLAAYQVRASRDAALTSSLRGALDRLGPAALLAAPPDPARMRHELVEFGFDSPIVSMTTVGDDARREALERIAREGLSPLFMQAGDITGDLALLGLTAGPSSCETLQGMHDQMEMVVAVTCALAVALPVLAPDCFAATSVLAMLKLIKYMRGC
jgi:hypothetical protein